MHKSISEQLIELGLAAPQPAEPKTHTRSRQEKKSSVAGTCGGESLRAQLIAQGLLRPAAKQRPSQVAAKKSAKSPVRGYLDENGKTLCPLCRKLMPYSQLDKHIAETHRASLGYYEDWTRGGAVRAKIVSGGGPGTGKRR